MLDRRSLLATAVAGAILPTPGFGASLLGARSGTGEVADQLRTFMRMHASLDGTSVTTVEGLIYGMAPGKAPKPLIEFHSLVEMQVSEVEPGLFRTRQREATWLGSGNAEDINRPFANPYTRETVVPFGYVTPVN